MPIPIKPDMNYGVWAEGGNIEIPSSQKVEQGWVVEKPLNETMNWLQNRQDRMLQYLNERGIPEWDIRTSYPLNAFVSHEGFIYKALAPNIDKNPTIQTSIWQVAFVSFSDFVDYAETINSITDDDGFVKHYVKKSDPVMNAAAKAPAYRNSEDTTGINFTEDLASVTRNGRVIVEFSGGTNPKDVVTHEQLAIAIQNYKVGDIYITTASGNPFERFGYGTWQRFGQGKTLVGFSESVSNDVPEWVKTAGATYGEYKQTINFPHKDWGVEGLEIRTSRAGVLVVGSGRQEINETLESLTQPIADLSTEVDKAQPSIVVYFWKRTA